MSEILLTTLLALVAFVVMDLFLGRLTVNDPVRLVIAAIFALLVLIFVRL